MVILIVYSVTVVMCVFSWERSSGGWVVVCVCGIVFGGGGVYVVEVVVVKCGGVCDLVAVVLGGGV